MESGSSAHTHHVKASLCKIKLGGNYRSLIETLPRISLFFLAHLDLPMALKPGGSGDLLPPTSGSPYGGFLKPGGGGGSGSLVAAAATKRIAGHSGIPICISSSRALDPDLRLWR
jgi:hypothetical protein